MLSMLSLLATNARAFSRSSDCRLGRWQERKKEGERCPGESSKQRNQLLRWRCSGRYRKPIAPADERAARVRHKRRTCARLCHGSGGELEQIQFLLGHASVQTTERYLGSKQKLQDAVAVNDRLGVSAAGETA
jgi:integrase